MYRTDNYAVFYAAPENPRVTFDVRRIPTMAAAQTVTVRVDGDVVDQHVLADDAWHTLSYPVEARSEDSPFCVELLTSPVWYDAEGSALLGRIIDRPLIAPGARIGNPSVDRE